MDLDVRLRNLAEVDRRACLEAFGLIGFPPGWQERGGWPGYLRALAGWERGKGLPDGWVPCTVLAITAGGSVAGRVTLRFGDCDVGHVGYAVVPSWRRRGVATAALRAGAGLLRARGVDPATVSCHEGNLASRRVIEKAGGVLIPGRAGPPGELYFAVRGRTAPR